METMTETTEVMRRQRQRRCRDNRDDCGDDAEMTTETMVKTITRRNVLFLLLYNLDYITMG